MASSLNNARKRQLALTTTATTAATDAAMEEEEEPALQRPRHQDVLSTQLETLQAELEHERSLRMLDQKRFATTRQRLERQVQFAVEETKESKTLLEEYKAESQEYANRIKTKYQRLQQDYQDLRYRADCERAEIPEPDGRLEELEELLELRQEENQGLLETIEKLQEEVQNVLRRKSVPPPARENALLQVSPAPPKVMKELNAARLELQEAQRQVRQLTRINTQLQAQQEELKQSRLQESNAISRVKRLEQQAEEYNQTLALAQAQVDSWKEFGVQLANILQITNNTNNKKNSGVPPELAVIHRHLQQATQQARDLKVEKENLESRLDQADLKFQALTGTLRQTEQAKTNAEEKVHDMKQQADVLKRQISVQQGQEDLRKREVETLRSIVKTFDELPLPNKTIGGGNFDAQVKMVQASLDAKEEELKLLRQAETDSKLELSKTLQAKSDLQTKHHTVLEKFAKLREAVYAERNKAEKAEARAVQAETLAGKGSFNPETTRVVHLQTNPLTEALKQEVNVLKRQVEVLKSKKSSTNSSSAAAPMGALTPDVDPNKLHQRLKESFKEQIGRFREGVYLLTGFKIDMIPDGERPKFKVRSMYAERENDQLLFQWPDVTPVESLDLLDTELAKLLMTTPSYEYVTRFGSLPTFLASTQLSLFEKQTMI